MLASVQYPNDAALDGLAMKELTRLPISMVKRGTSGGGAKLRTRKQVPAF